MLERISRRERFDLIVAWVAIAIAFSLIFVRQEGSVTLNRYLILLGLSLITVGVGFVLHELAHKFTAMRFGYWAEFRKDNLMLLVAVVLAALVGVVFAAPGATIIYGAGVTREQNGKISAAGPAINLILCIPFALLLLVGGSLDPATTSRSLLLMAGMVGLQVNAMIAAFNMLPVSVLDGKKVLAWNPAVFAVLIVAAFGILLASFTGLLL
ncbi:putative zn-dependent protease [hydrocarbon metagenome]|uniref:Putative zn-dependent protease n=1 Tax=hydrocarbon metagenome TaxID=938273 RepID=A0A0W8F1Z4_9ZZZZ